MASIHKFIFILTAALLLLWQGPIFATSTPHTRCDSSSQDIHGSSVALDYATSGSKTISFKKNKFPKDYDAMMAHLAPGDVIETPSGKRYTVKKILGEGGLTKVVDIGEGKALRLPRQSKVEHLFGDVNERAMKSFVKLQKELKANGVPVVELYEDLSEPPLILMVEKKDFQFIGSQFFEEPPRGAVAALTKAERKKALKAFEDFVEQTWAYADIGDFTPRQMGYDGEKWILFDFYEEAVPAHNPLRRFDQEDTIVRTKKFEDIDYGGKVTERFVPKEVEKDLKKRLMKIRKEKSKEGEWFQRSSKRVSTHSEFIDRITPNPLSKGFKKYFSIKEYSWRKRDYRGYLPKEQDVSIEVLSHVGDHKNMAEYEVLVNGQFKAKLHLVTDSEDVFPKEVKKAVSKLEKNGIPYLAGDDFVLIYEDSSVKKSLSKI